MQDYLVEALKKPPYVLFGSSFPKDKDYTQVNSSMLCGKISAYMCNTLCMLRATYAVLESVEFIYSWTTLEHFCTVRGIKFMVFS